MNATASDQIEIHGAREHNLKNLNINIPRNALVVITGLSGSGKSSLAFDTIFAEGQRRYIETFSAYARQFIGNLQRPDVDKIDGLSPVIAIEQKTTIKNPRSTVGTTTEIYDFLRLLFARAADAFSYVTNLKMVSYTEEEIAERIIESYQEQKIYLLAPIIRSRKGHYKELFEQLAKKGYLKLRIDGEITEITKGLKLDRYKIHDIELVIDQLKVIPTEDFKKRLVRSLNTAMKEGEGSIMVLPHQGEDLRYFSKHLMCAESGISYALPEPNTFSFNSPKGACEACNGLGTKYEVAEDKIFPDPKKSIKNGAIAPHASHNNQWLNKQLEAIAIKFGFALTDPLEKIPKQAKEVLLYGGKDSFSIAKKNIGVTKDYQYNFEGIVPFLEKTLQHNDTPSLVRWAKGFMNKIPCPECQGSRLKQSSLYFKIAEKNIAELCGMDIEELKHWFDHCQEAMTEKQWKIAEEVVKEIRTRLQFLLDVGLGYLSIDRPTRSLSGGESQRIRLATQIGAQLVNVLYILDEPSIGLHQRDNQRLIKSLQALKDIGNSIIVVEHDQDMMEVADHIIDMGPAAGKHGGRVVAQGDYQSILSADSITAEYLSGKKSIELPNERRKGNGKKLQLIEAVGHNLKKVNLSIPLGTLCLVTGVSGSGKSSLINETLYPILNRHFFNAVKEPLPYKSIKGVQHIDKVIDIDQSPIGRTPRSCPATYTGVFDEIRKLYSGIPEAAIRGYKPGRFSFNVKGGRCETCQGDGLRVIEMNFLPDVYIPCETCRGKRFNRETLEIRYKSKSIADVLEMKVDEAVDFFEAIPKIYKKLKTLQEVGLGYISLGQQSTTLSGGEAQRIKLATELAKKDTGNTFYILDEPTTGLHFEDIRILMEVLRKLVHRGNTVLVIEHNLDVIKCADYIIDIGPEGGKAGGKIVAEGTPEAVAKVKASYTGNFLRKVLIKKS